MAKVHVKADRAPSTALATRSPAPANIWDDIRLQKLWLGVERREWRSLAVIGADQGVETVQLAELLAQLAWRYRGQPSSVCDLRDLSMRLVDYQVREMHAQIDGGTRLVISLRSIFENPTASLIAQQADAVVICLSLGATTFKAAEETIAAVGRDHVMGSIVMRPKATAGRRSRASR